MFTYTIIDPTQPVRHYEGFRSIYRFEFEKDTLVVLAFAGGSIDIWECNDKVGVENLSQFYRDNGAEVTMKVLKQ